MTNAQHTPGPWAIEPDALGEYSIVTDNGGTIADVYGRNPANARLIAAVPELLAALDKLLTLNRTQGVTQEEYEAAEEEAEAAWSKATGK